ncbi:myrosinase 4 [Capsella rubella]|uniref:myrosinase 4 n=1 Tax=Capsella rubella TaxID=81985 RepID=UPI000CD4D618|nr:myrosinase 4 [Capsella rubella]XP_023634597.1 myrosinase 4 [Capsella rubella]XP_023634598.1 myrosinase 4 [Capsella rubella]
MTLSETFIFVLLFAALSATSQRVCDPVCQAKEPFNCNDVQIFSRIDFPRNFTFGAATSAYQTEGAARRAVNGWDYYTHRYPERVPDRTTGDLACNSYELYKEDVQLLKRLNVQAYRFSIAWSRVLPKGKLCGGVDENGIKYYDNLIDELKANGIEPFVTIFHWDVPQALEDEYGGFLNRRIVEDFKDYAELLFQRFGDRVKYWMTFNQPYTFAKRGYGGGTFPPGRCTGCEFGGNSGTEPYIVGYHQLLAHATTVFTYRQKYKRLQGGNVGIALIGKWFVPLNEASVSDQMAAGRAFDFIVGWFLDPLVYGDYPMIMKDTLGKRLPRFTDLESQLVKGSMDFLGLNYYFTQYATDSLQPISNPPNVHTDPRANFSTSRGGVLIGVQSANFAYYPPGLRQILNYIKDNYENPLTYITENGFSTFGNLILAEALADQGRIESHCSHLSCLKCAIEDGCNVAGYFPWSSMDNYEFSQGYTIRFGMNWVNFSNPADRKEKDSAKWYSKFNKEKNEVQTQTLFLS